MDRPAAPSAGSREVEPRRRRRSPSDHRRKIRRALERAERTAAENHSAATERQRSQAAGERNRAASLTTDLDNGFKQLRTERGDVYAAAGTHEGHGFRGKVQGYGR